MRIECSLHSISGAHHLRPDGSNWIWLTLSLHYRDFHPSEVLGEFDMPEGADTDQSDEGNDERNALSAGFGDDDVIPCGLAPEDPDNNAETKIPCILLSSNDKEDDDSIVFLGSDCPSYNTAGAMRGQAFVSLSERSDTGTVPQDCDLAPTSPPKIPLPVL